MFFEVREIETGLYLEGITCENEEDVPHVLAKMCERDRGLRDTLERTKHIIVKCKV